MKIIIAILVVIFVIDAAIVYSCCRAAGWADEKMEEIWRNCIDQEKTC